MYTPYRFDSFSFGCRVNEAERVELDRKMVGAGFLKNSSNPDIYIVNTCAVTAKAEREARQLILRLKRQNPRLKLVVTGCSATYWAKNQLWSNMPIDLIISNTDKEYAASLIAKRFPRKLSLKREKAKADGYLDKFLDSGRLMVKIQDGCHRFCSYCIVPYLRGAPVSRRADEIVRHINSFGSGIKEAVLTAINTEAFGRDTGESLEYLVQTVLAETSVPRLSFGSVHPWSLTPSFVNLYAEAEPAGRFGRFFHVPLQSGSNRVLSLMKREYTREAIRERLNELKRVNPDTLLATDIIVGFLDESDTDFAETYQFLERSPFSRFHVFRFSKRQNTAAFYLSRRLREPTPEEKLKRSKALLKLSERKYGRFLESQVGKTGTALIIGTATHGYQKALLANQVQLRVPVTDTLSGTLKRVTITKLQKGSLVGRIVG